MKIRLWIVAIVISAGFRPATMVSQTPTEARKGCDATLQNLARSATKGDISSALSLWTDDAIDIEADGSVYKGKPGLRQLFERQKTVEIKSANPVINDFGSSGPLAYGGGLLTIEGTDKATGKPLKTTVHFLFIFKQQADKRWLISHEVDSPIRDAKK